MSDAACERNVVLTSCKYFYGSSALVEPGVGVGDDCCFCGLTEPSHGKATIE
jgi:hypothetical protein